MRSKRTHLWTLIFALLAISLTVFSYRYFVLGVPLQPETEVRSWTVEANLRFNSKMNVPIKASFTIPHLPPYYAVLDEYFVSHNYGVTTNLADFNRETVWSIRRAKGLQSLYYRAIFRKTAFDELPFAKPKPLVKMPLKETEKSAVDAITNQARKASADIETFAQATIKQLKQANDNVAILVGKNKTNKKLVKAAILVLNNANIHAMSVSGLSLKTQQYAKLSSWLLVYNNKNWIFINPNTSAKEIPQDFLIWQYGDKPLYQVSGGVKPRFNITVTPSSVSAVNLARIRGTQTQSKLIKFSLLQLPLDVQETYKVLLTVPIGAFIILLLRNFVGLLTFGTFMPVLIALAFRQTHLVWGVTLFTLIVSFGLLARFYLDQLRLLLVPRLACILTVVIFLMAFISVFCQQMGVNAGLSVALFPMVILTMVIERMCITWDERGALEAIQAGGGSLVAASICYLAMSNEEVGYLMFAFPELLLSLMALILIFGQYRGYRLSEIIRFKALAA